MGRCGPTKVPEMIPSYLKGMTPAQLEATQHIEGPAMVLAAPGSGKTRVITYRIAHLVKEGENPGNIVAITFTNKAAKEMRRRINSILPEEEAKLVHISTFHSLCARLLRVEYEAAGLHKTYTICDESDASTYVIQSIALITGADPKKVKGWKDYRNPILVRKKISKIKQRVLTPEEYTKSIDRDDEQEVFFAQAYQRYQTILEKNRSVDFDDLIMKTVLLLREDKYVRSKYARRTEYLLVDEYQDTNPSQYELVNTLGSYWGNVMVVGDPDQSIYKFRGATIENITKFENDHEDTIAVYYLQENFRSTKAIAAVANELIDNNQDRKPKEINAVHSRGTPVRCIESLDTKQEAAAVVDEIMTEVKMGRARYKDFAILYRMHSKSRIFEDLMVAHHVPHKIIGGIGFYNRAVVKDMLAYAKLTLNEFDEASFTRIYDKPSRGFGDVSYSKLYELKEEEGTNFVDVLVEGKFEGVITGRPLSGAQKLQTAFTKLRDQPTDKVAPLITNIAKIVGYQGYIENGQSDKVIGRLDTLDELITAATEFDKEHKGGLTRFIEWTSLMQSTDEKEGKDHVTLMTCHAAKGLEFPSLYVIGAVEGSMPILRETDDFGRTKTPAEIRADIEEERRVFFVAVTRAEQRLTVTYSKRVFFRGQMLDAAPSRYIAELGESAEHESIADKPVGTYLLAAIGKKYDAPRRRRSSNWGNTRPTRRRRNSGYWRR